VLIQTNSAQELGLRVVVREITKIAAQVTGEQPHTKG
jgi:hypothetical protein